jgi:hypothetical protein
MEGAFCVQRLNTIAPSWVVGSNSINQTSDYPGLYYCYTYTIGSDGAGHFVPIAEDANEGDAPPFKTLMDTMWTTDMTMSWVKFSGLSLNFNSANPDSPSMQLMAVKQYIGVEIQPSPISAWCAMMKLGPKPDLQSMQALMDAFYEIKDVLPARYNFWGTLGSIAAQGLKTFGSSILENLMKGDGSKTKSKQGKTKQKKSSAGKETAEVRDVVHKEDAIIKKLDQFMARFTQGLQISGGTRTNRRKRRNKRGKSRAPPVVPPGQVNQANPPVPKPRRQRKPRADSLPA